MTGALARGRERFALPGGEGPRLRAPRKRCSSLSARGEPMLWVTGASLAICLLMIATLLVWIAWQGFGTFWPTEVVSIATYDGRRLTGEITREESYRPDPTLLAAFDGAAAARARQELAASDGWAERSLVRTGNFELTGTHFHWVNGFEIASRDYPSWAIAVERLEWGRFYGELRAYVHLTPVVAREPDAARAEAREIGARLQEDGGAELRVLVERTVDGARRERIVGLDEIEPGDAVRAVARLWSGPEVAWAKLEELHPQVRELWRRKRHLEQAEMGEVHGRLEAARLRLRAAELELSPPPAWIAAYRARAQARAAQDASAVERLQASLEQTERELGAPSAAFRQVVDEVELAEARARQAYDELTEEIRQLDRAMERHAILAATSRPDEQKLLRLSEIVRAYPANRLGWIDRLGVYLSRWWEFVSDEPRESNFEGGVLPAIFGTVLMTLIMCFFVVPFGVLAALYVREYAKAGPVISTVRIAVNNLAGVPSIVFGVFGLGFFCYIVGSSIDELFYPERLPQPTFGTGGLFWASLTLALLTLPVVIVATEEALAAVPSSMREGSYACGASKWQTIRRIVLPRAMPGIMTGAILAMARGAGEVAPLMLVGAVKLAPKLPLLDGGELLGLNSSFMHLGFHIYDLGFQSQNSEAAKPMVFTTTLLLIAIIAALNLTAVWLRTRLHRRFVGSHF